MLTRISNDDLFVAGLFATATLLGYGAIAMIARLRGSAVSKRLQPASGVKSIEIRKSDSMMLRMSGAAAKPFMPKDAANQSKLRRKLIMAGFYSPKAMHALVAAKVMLMAGAAVGAYLLGPAGMRAWVMGYAGLALGYLLPDMWLRTKTRGRQRVLERALPDALDLLVVCVESGLTLDAAIQRVGTEISLAHPEISQELGITHMETRVGVPRIEAMKSLGARTGSAALQSLAAMLVQAERFGTGIAHALRVHSESLRVKRQHLAEEMAMKTSVKLAFPVVLFIFPTLLVVLGGPAVILFMRSPLFTNN